MTNLSFQVGPDFQVTCLHVESDSITRFGGGVEQHSYPSSLKFCCSILSSEGHIQVLVVILRAVQDID